MKKKKKKAIGVLLLGQIFFALKVCMQPKEDTKRGHPAVIFLQSYNLLNSDWLKVCIKRDELAKHLKKGYNKRFREKFFFFLAAT